MPGRDGGRAAGEPDGQVARRASSITSTGKRYTILPNTAGCFTAEDALRYARLGREALGLDWVKLEVLSDPDSLLPEPIQTLEALKVLMGGGAVVPALRQTPG